MASATLETSARRRSPIVFPEPDSVDGRSFGARAGVEFQAVALVLPELQLGAGLRCAPILRRISGTEPKGVSNDGANELAGRAGLKESGTEIAAVAIRDAPCP